MLLDDSALYRMAGYSAVIALVALVLAAVTIALFFGGAGQVFGPLNDAFVVIMMLALLLPIVAIHRLVGDSVGTWFTIVSIAALVGAVVVAVGQTLLIVGVIDLQSSFVTGGVGIIPVLAWVVALAVLAFGADVLPDAIGATAVFALLSIVALSVVGLATTGPAMWMVVVVTTVAIGAWLASLSIDLLGRTTA